MCKKILTKNSWDVPLSVVNDPRVLKNPNFGIELVDGNRKLKIPSSELFLHPDEANSLVYFDSGSGCVAEFNFWNKKVFARGSNEQIGVIIENSLSLHNAKKAQTG